MDRAFLNLWYYCQYHLIMPTMSREPLFLQELNGGDNNRTSATFQAPDTYRFVGEITDFVPD